MLRVVLFTGGRGSGVLSRPLLAGAGIDLVLAINGYDDGGSTGEVRRFLGDCLGPSDFRKNASRVATAKASCSSELVRLLDTRTPAGLTPEAAIADLSRLVEGRPTTWLDGRLSLHERRGMAERLDAFLRAYQQDGRPFDFGDCAVGNLVFAGAFLLQGRRFNAAVDDYAGLVGLPPGLIESVTDGRNAHLVAMEADGTVFGTEEAVVTVPPKTRIEDLFLIDRPLSPDECAALGALGPDGAREALAARSVPVLLNPRLAARIDEADLIVYAPGTQHSSLYPSYLTEGLPQRLAANIAATKLLITNLESDVEIARQDAVTLVQRALFYLTQRGCHPFPAPCLVTHYVLNDPGGPSEDRPLVPLGQVQTFEDSRMVRIDRFEDGETGRHNAEKVLQPFIEARIESAQAPRVAVLLYGETSTNTLVQTLLEIARSLPRDEADLTVYLATDAALPEELMSRLPFAVDVQPSLAEAEWWLRVAVDSHQYDFVALFESSGVYRGEDLTALLQYLHQPRLSAVWGSRRLSMLDIREAYRHRKYPSWTMRAASRAGSHLLSLAYLTLHGRYVSDTLSGLRIMRASEYSRLKVPVDHPAVNQHLLAAMLRRRADFIEVPVQFLPSPHRRQVMSLAAGLAMLLLICWHRFARFTDFTP